MEGRGKGRGRGKGLGTPHNLYAAYAHVQQVIHITSVNSESPITVRSVDTFVGKTACPHVNT
jgi:hypothetical protein